MASISFPLPNNPTARRTFSATTAPARHRVSATTPRHAIQTASLYEVLGVGAGATCKEIKSAYRKMARVLHPDVVSDGRGDEFMRLQAAYATLSDPAARAVYDRSVFRLQRMSVKPLAGGPSELTRRSRNWETDQCW